jgi:hypothetical protein
MALPDFKTHFGNHYMKRISNYLLLRRISSWCLPIFVVLIYSSLPLMSLWPNSVYTFLAVGLTPGIIWLLSTFYILLRPQKTKDVLAYHLLKASEFFQAYSSDNDKKAKDRFREKCLSHVREAGELLKETLGRARISLDLPDLRQLKALQNNMMTRIYPMIQEGRNTSDDILLSLSKIFFYENEYERLPEFNLTMDQTLQFRSYEEKRWHIPTKLKQNIALRCVIGIMVIITAILGAIYVLKSPSGTTEYWQFVGQNAATVAGAIVTSSVAISIFIWSRARTLKATQADGLTNPKG